jgi:glucose/arabinose dehydrogenase
MKKYFYIYSVLLLLFFRLPAVSAQTSIKIGNTTVDVDTVFTGLDIPWEITWGPDSVIWATERKGIVSRIHPLLKSQAVILDISASIYQQSESGLLGMALHPDFENEPEVFIVYTYRENNSTKERLVKYIYNGSALINPDTLISGIQGNTTHDGSRLLFLPDNTLLMTTGDAQNQASPQDSSSLNGKVLRLNTDGTIPLDNPFPGSYIYTMGHRNAQGLTLAPNGRVYLSEHGPDSDDEVQELIKGRNYGWPNVKGFCDQQSEMAFCTDQQVVEPLIAWTPTIAPAGLEYYKNPAFPEFDSCLLLTVLKDKKLIALKLNANGSAITKQTHYLTNTFGRLRDICIGTDNEIYLATNGNQSNNTQPNTHSIIRLTPRNKTSIRQTQVWPSVNIYPNPSTGFISVDLGRFTSEKTSVQLVDMNGKVCQQEITEEQYLQWSAHQISKGIYMLRVFCGDVLVSQTKVVLVE